MKLASIQSKTSFEYSSHFHVKLTFLIVILNLVLSCHLGWGHTTSHSTCRYPSFYDIIFRTTFFSSIRMKNIVLSKAQHESWKLISFPVPLLGCHEVCWKMKRLDFHSDSYFSNKFLLKGHIWVFHDFSWFVGIDER